MYEIKLPRVTRPRSRQELEWEAGLRRRFGELPSSDVQHGDVWRPGYRVREVRHSTAHEARRAVYRHASYLHRENDWKIQYQINTDSRARAFLWIDTAPGNAGLGSVCFYPRKDGERTSTWWALQWAWFHPYVRGKGLLSEIWPYFRMRFGDFDAEGPLSSGMRTSLHVLEVIRSRPWSRRRDRSAWMLHSPTTDLG
jgi:hypothetical protein